MASNKNAGLNIQVKSVLAEKRGAMEAAFHSCVPEIFKLPPQSPKDIYMWRDNIAAEGGAAPKVIELPHLVMHRVFPWPCCMHALGTSLTTALLMLPT